MNDSSVATLDLLAFRTADGMIDTWKRVSGGTVSAMVTRGVELDWYVFANAPEGAFASVKNESALQSLLFDFAGTDGLTVPMGASGTAVFDASTPLHQVDLVRLVSLVELGTVVTQFADGLDGSTVTLVRAFLVNVCGGVTYTGTATFAGSWYNCLGWDSSLPAPLPSLLGYPVGADITDPGSLEVNAKLYCCPNPVDNGVTSKTEPDWSPRNTRLVVEMLIGGQTHYYPVTLPAMLPNRSYRIPELRLLGGGSSSPDILVERAGVRFTVDVSDWVDAEQEVTLH